MKEKKNSMCFKTYNPGLKFLEIQSSVIVDIGFLLQVFNG